MLTLLLFVAAISTLGNSKFEGFVIQTRTRRRVSTHLIKSLGKSKVNLTAREEKEHGENANVDSLESWYKKKDDWLMEMWNDAWDVLTKEVESEDTKPRPESEVELDGDEEKKEWEILVDALLGTSTNAVGNGIGYTRQRGRNEEPDVKRKVQDQVLEQSRFFINPKYRRRDIKWVQSTDETERIFLIHKISEDVRESVFRYIYEEAIDKSCNETYRCFLFISFLIFFIIGVS